MPDSLRSQSPQEIPARPRSRIGRSRPVSRNTAHVNTGFQADEDGYTADIDSKYPHKVIIVFFRVINLLLGL